MISNNRKNQFPIPQSLVDAQAEMQRIAQTTDKNAIKNSTYKGERTVNGEKVYEVREVLKTIYHNKCAYCEKIEHKPEIEHYRPKKGVTKTKHKGYYWLCYEWTNLIPSCRYCNTEGGKGNQFPIIGNRTNSPTFLAFNDLDFEACKAQNSPLIDEQPYLFHPEVDANISDNFDFFENGRMRGIDHQGRGRQTIRICNLNRENLLFHRQKIVDTCFRSLNNLLDDYFKTKISKQQLQYFLIREFLQIQINSKSNKPFSALSKYIQNHFNSIIVPLFQTPKQRLIVERAYRKFQDGTLLN